MMETNKSGKEMGSELSEVQRALFYWNQSQEGNNEFGEPQEFTEAERQYEIKRSNE